MYIRHLRLSKLSAALRPSPAAFGSAALLRRRGARGRAPARLRAAQHALLGLHARVPQRARARERDAGRVQPRHGRREEEDRERDDANNKNE